MAIARVKHILIPNPIYRVSSPSTFSSSSSSSQPQGSDIDQTKITTVVSVLKEQHSKSRWSFVKRLCPNGFSTTEASQIMLHVRNNPNLALRFFLWSEQISFCKHDLISYPTIIHILARAGFRAEATELIQTAIRITEVGNIDDPDRLLKQPKIFKALTQTYRSCNSAPVVFDLLIEACIQARKIDRAVVIAKMLRSRRIYPLIGTCNSLIKLVSEMKGANAGLDIYEEIFGYNENIGREKKARVSPDVETFNTLILSFYQEGMTERVKEFLMEIEKHGCVPNIYSYSILIATFCDEGKMVEAMRLWEDMKFKKMKPDVMAYNTLIKGFCEKTEVLKANKLFREMKLCEIEPTCLTYEYMIVGYCKTGNVDPALLLYKEMCKKDFRPEASTVEEVIRATCAKSRVYDGLDFLKKSKRNLDFLPSRNSYQCLISGLCKLGKMEEALKLQADMLDKGYTLSSEVYNAFIEGYAGMGDKEN